ncbi:MAG: hypothetical protein ABWZ40_01895 [Caulobacterales bacterium]
MTDDVETLPSPWGLMRFPATRGYFEGLGEKYRTPCTCNDDCRVLYCTGRECGCEACALELGQRLSEDEACGKGGFDLNYTGAMQAYGRNIADYLSPLWADQKPLQQRYIRLATRQIEVTGRPPEVLEHLTPYLRAG